MKKLVTLSLCYFLFACNNDLIKEHNELFTKSKEIVANHELWEKINSELKEQYKDVDQNKMDIVSLAEMKGKVELMLSELDNILAQIDSFNVNLRKHQLKHGCK